jgi:hypothetical protein
MNTPPKLTFARADRDASDRPFEDDLLGGRDDLASNLSQFLTRLSRGGVIAIHAPWGAGKTWFGERWADSLRPQHRVVYIDAFSQDHIEDPFLLIAAEFSRVIESDKKSTFLKKAGEVASAVAPTALKASLHIAAKVALRGVDIGKEYEEIVKATEEKSEEFLQHWLERKLENFEKEKKSLAAFRKALEEVAADEQHPIVVFVDELDRCRPDFAVKLIERIKHFFDTPNVVFVLLLNRDQLERSVEGVYGATTEGDAYLSKFINFFFTLPEANTQSFIATQLNRFGIKNMGDFCESLSVLARYAALSLREIEKACALYAYANNRSRGALLAYFATLKIKRADLYGMMLSGDDTAYSRAHKWLGELANRHRLLLKNDWETSYLAELTTMHGALVDPNRKLERPFRIIGSEHLSSTSLPDYIMKTCREIDLPIF